MRVLERDCRSLPGIANGKYSYSPEGAEETLFGATATAQCDTGSVNVFQFFIFFSAHLLNGNNFIVFIFNQILLFSFRSYQLVGKATRRCLAAGWDGRDVTCQGVGFLTF